MKIFFRGENGQIKRIYGLGTQVYNSPYEGDDPAISKEAYAKGAIPPAEGFILRHILEHLPNPLGFLRDLAEGNGWRGKVYIEVPSLDWILEHRAWWDLYYEHVNYFRLGDLFRMFGYKHETGHLFGGQYIYTVAELSSFRELEAVEPAEFPDMWPVFMAGDRYKPEAIWGAASKGVLYAIERACQGLPISFAIDINPAKQGKFLPVTGLPVLSPEQAFERLEYRDRILVANPAYMEEITEMTHGRYTLVPL